MYYVKIPHQILRWSFKQLHIELTVIKIVKNGKMVNNEKVFITTGFLFSQCLGDVQKENGKPRTIFYHLLQRPRIIILFCISHGSLFSDTIDTISEEVVFPNAPCL